MNGPASSRWNKPRRPLRECPSTVPSLNGYVMNEFVKTMADIVRETTTAQTKSTPRSRELTQDINQTWHIWITRFNVSNAKDRGEELGRRTYDWIMQEIQEDEWLGVRHYFMALFWEKMKSSNEVERKFSQGIFEGFKECMTRDDGDTVCGLTSFLFQPAYVRIYFQRLISTNKSRKDEHEVENATTKEIERNWMEWAVKESDSVAAGKYFGRLMYDHACAWISEEELPWFFETCFPNKFETYRESGLARYSQDARAAARVQEFYANALDTFQKWAKKRLDGG